MLNLKIVFLAVLLITVNSQENGMDLLEPHINSGRGVSFKADNGKWLSILGSSANLEAAKDPKDAFCRFEIEKFDESSVYLRAKNNKYLSRMYIGRQAIQSAKASPDVNCRFEVFKQNGMVAFRAYNNKYLGRVERQGKHHIEPSKDNIDYVTRFIVQSHSPAAWSTWGTWSADCTNVDFRPTTRRRRERTCPDGTCVGEKYSYKHNCNAGVLSLGIDYSITRSSTTTPYKEGKHLTVGNKYATKFRMNNIQSAALLLYMKAFSSWTDPPNGPVAYYDGRVNSIGIASSLSGLTIDATTTHVSALNDGVKTLIGRTLATGSLTAGTPYVRFTTDYMPTGSPSSSYTASQVLQINNNFFGEGYFVVQQIYKKVAATQNVVSYSDSTGDRLTYEIPGQRIRFLAGISDDGYSTDISVTVYFAKQFDISKGINRYLTDRICGSYYSVTANENINSITYKIPSNVGSKGRTCELYTEVFLASNGHMMWDIQAQPFTHIDWSFCSGGRPCSAVTTGTSRGRLTKSYSLQHTKNELIEPKRLKHRDTGLCFEVESGTEYVIRTSRCRDSFYLAADEPFLIHVQSGKKVGQRAGETKLQLVNNESDAKIFTLTYVSVTSNGKSGQKKKLGMYPTQEDYQGKTQCMEYPNSPTYITFGPVTTPKSTGFCGDKLAFIRAFPQDIMDKISMKSMLKISTSKGSTLFVCTPSKDLWSNSNCLYSLDDGAKWIAMTPKITELKAFIPSEDSFYGLCHSAKYHCKYHVETGLLHYVTLTEYQSKLSDVNMVSITNLEDMQLAGTPEDTDFTSIKVSTLGLYRQETTDIRIFLWANMEQF